MESLNGLISDNTLKNLSDKSIEKRKLAATEIGGITDELVSQNKDTDVKKLIEFFSIQIDEDQPQKRRTGLYGLSSIAVALYQHGSSNYLELLIKPVMDAFSDKEPKVQLAAWDAMFNILKVCKDDILKYNFPLTFDRIVSIVSYPNADVKDWGGKLVEQLEDIVYGALVKNNIFDLDALLDKIYSKLSKSKNQDICYVLIRWIETLSSMTNVDILKCLPRFLEKFFEIMSTNQKHKVYDLALSQLKIFLKDYAQWQCRSVDLDIQILEKCLKFLLDKKSLDIDKSRYLAIIWYEEFLKFFNEDLLKESAVDEQHDDDENYFYENPDSPSQNIGLEEEKVAPLPIDDIVEESKGSDKDKDDAKEKFRLKIGNFCLWFYITSLLTFDLDV